MLTILIQKALNDTEFLLREDFKYPKISVGSQCSLFHNNTNDDDYSSSENYIHNPRQQLVLPFGVSSLSRSKVVGLTSNVYIEHSNKLTQKKHANQEALADHSLQSTDLLANLNRAFNINNEHGDDDAWHMSMTLLQTDLVKGPRINDSGPIYMFVARQLK
ncbi:unnamed protein product [Heterobilharzia americana]|nr:unnamed protein product [Heterobilharzia americana]